MLNKIIHVTQPVGEGRFVFKKGNYYQEGFYVDLDQVTTLFQIQNYSIVWRRHTKFLVKSHCKIGYNHSDNILKPQTFNITLKPMISST